MCSASSRPTIFTAAASIMKVGTEWGLIIGGQTLGAGHALAAIKLTTG